MGERKRNITNVQAEGGTFKNSDSDAGPIFWGLKFGQILFFGLPGTGAIFLRLHKTSAIFWGSSKLRPIFWVPKFKMVIITFLKF